VTEISASTGSVTENVRQAESIATATKELSGEVANAAELMEQQAVQSREQVARFALQLRESGASAAGRRCLTAREPKEHTSRTLRAIRA
jgi:hypothetical protein